MAKVVKNPFLNLSQTLPNHQIFPLFAFELLYHNFPKLVFSLVAKDQEGLRPHKNKSLTSTTTLSPFRAQRVAYVTLLHSSEVYVCGAIALAQSIRQSGSTKDMILLHDDSIKNSSRIGLSLAGWKLRRVERIRSPFSKKGSYNEWNYSKLRVWQVTDYDKLVFIDADFIIAKNIDYLFFYPQLSAAGNNKVLFNSGVMVRNANAIC